MPQIAPFWRRWCRRRDSCEGGPQILEACREIRRTRFPRGLPTGGAVLTTGGHLLARYVIHTVGPITKIGHEPDASMLASCYRNALALAADNGLRSIAFPAISTGECSWKFKPSGVVAGDSLDEMVNEYETQRDKEFAAHTCVKHPRPKVPKTR